MRDISFLLVAVLTTVACNNGAEMKGTGKSGAGPLSIAPQPASPASSPSSPSAPIEPDRIIGDDLGQVTGYYDNPSWGKMLIEIDGDKIYGTYDFRFGAHQGTIDRSSGVASVVWCESDSETGARRYRGIAEFVFRKDDTNALRLKGKWKEGAAAATPWIEDWDITKVAAAAPAVLVDRMSRKGAPTFCDQP